MRRGRRWGWWSGRLLLDSGSAVEPGVIRKGELRARLFLWYQYDFIRCVSNSSPEGGAQELDSRAG